VLQGNIHWHSLSFGDWFIHDLPSLIGILHCFMITTLFIQWRIRCKVGFGHEVISLSSFCSMWCDEVLHKILPKGDLSRKYSFSLNPIDYYESILVLVTRMKRISSHMYNTHFVNFCKYLHVDLICILKKRFQVDVFPYHCVLTQI
jgi:hypothetical protein